MVKYLNGFIWWMYIQSLVYGRAVLYTRVFNLPVTVRLPSHKQNLETFSSVNVAVKKIIVFFSIITIPK